MLQKIIDKLFGPLEIVYAHCDLPCGEYDPEQARIEAESALHIMQKYEKSTDEYFKTRAIFIKEQRLELVKHHLWVLWTDYFTPEHLKKYPNLHDLFWRATKKAGEAKRVSDVKLGEELMKLIKEIDVIFKETKKASK
jgi:nickel superoxide dismutase